MIKAAQLQGIVKAVLNFKHKLNITYKWKYLCGCSKVKIGMSYTACLYKTKLPDFLCYLLAKREIDVLEVRWFSLSQTQTLFLDLVLELKLNKYSFCCEKYQTAEKLFTK